MLTRLGLQHGKGELEEFDPEIGKRKVVHQSTMTGTENVETPEATEMKPMDETQIQQMFMNVQEMLEELYEDKKKRDEALSSKASKKCKGKVDKSPPSSPSSSSSSSTSSSELDEEKKIKSPLLKLDVNFELPVYDGEMNPEKLDNWVKKLEVYFHIQNITDDKTKIQLATLRMGGTALIWWESKT